MTRLQAQSMAGERTPAQVVPLDITVLAGGPGAEREVSLLSGQAVNTALFRLGHRVTLCDINPDDLSALDRPADFIFIALHGEFGEDGTVQAEMDARGLPYCGSGAEASRLAMDKVLSKERFIQAGIPTPPYVVIDLTARPSAKPSFDPPAVVKPVGAGSSVDTIIARTQNDADNAAARLVRKYGAALIERYIRGPELTVGILGDRALPVCEIRTRREFYNYQAKYLDDDTQYLFDLDLPSALLTRVQQIAIEAHYALGCRAFSRVDFMLDAETLKPYVLEVNTIPGFTSHSLLPKAAGMVGMSFEQLVQRIVDLSLSDKTTHD